RRDRHDIRSPRAHLLRAMTALTPARRRELRAKAHHLHPVVSVGQHGLTSAVMREIDVNLLAHELIKVRVFSESREERDAMLERICAALGAAAVQHIGKLLVLWRPAPEASAGKATRVRRRDASAGARAQRKSPGKVRAGGHPMAKSAPPARRPPQP